MDTDTMTEQTTSAAYTDDSPQARLLRRPFQGRMLTGVAAGIADYLGIDPLLVRIAFATLVVLGGAGIPLYLAGLLLIPDEGSDQSIAASLLRSVQSR
jgi:phage shock protein C